MSNQRGMIRVFAFFSNKRENVLYLNFNSKLKILHNFLFFKAIQSNCNPQLKKKVKFNPKKNTTCTYILLRLSYVTQVHRVNTNVITIAAVVVVVVVVRFNETSKVFTSFIFIIIIILHHTIKDIHFVVFLLYSLRA